LHKQRWSPFEILVYIFSYTPQEVQQAMQDKQFLRSLRAFVIASIEIRTEAEKRARGKTNMPTEG